MMRVSVCLGAILIPEYLDFHSGYSAPRSRIAGLYSGLLKTGSLNYAIREFSMAKPSWYMSHYTMIYKNGERMRDFLGLFVFIVV